MRQRDKTKEDSGGQESDGGPDDVAATPRGDSVRGGDSVRAGSDVREGDSPNRSVSDRGSRRVSTDSVFREDPLKRELEPLDFSPSSTATDPADAKHDLGTDYQTGRHAYTENATYPAERMAASSSRWQTLNEANRDFFANDDEHIESARRQQDLHNDVRTWGTQIGLTDSEITAAMELVNATAPGVRRNFGMETIILGALTIAANQAATNNYVAKSIRRGGPTTGHTDLVDTYEQLRRDLHVDPSRVQRFRSWVHKTNPTSQD